MAKLKKHIDDATKNKVNRIFVSVVKTHEVLGITFLKKTETKHCQDNICHYNSDDIYLFGIIRIYSLIKGTWQRK